VKNRFFMALFPISAKYKPLVPVIKNVKCFGTCSAQDLL
jgi:hypothetical protein